jgi:hypothetical protein
MNTFFSYYWKNESITDTKLISVLNELLFSDNKEEKLNSLNTILKTNNSIVIGIYFDNYFYNGTLSRWGVENNLDQFNSQTLVKAREILNQKHVHSFSHKHASYLSAFGILARLGTQQDIALIENIISTVKTRDTELDASILMALSFSCISDYTGYNSIIFDYLKGFAIKKILPSDICNYTWSALTNYKIKEVEGFLLNLLNSDDVYFQIRAAYSLDIEKHFDSIKQAAKRWPTVLIWEGEETIRLIKEFEETIK